MAVRIRVKDTMLNEYEFMINDENSILVSYNCDGIFKSITPDFRDISLSDISYMISKRGYHPEDVGFDLSDYTDEILREMNIQDFYDYLEDDIDSFIKIMNKKGYKITKNE
jgi:hypothetical protein